MAIFFSHTHGFEANLPMLSAEQTHIERAKETISGAIDMRNSQSEHWCLAELLRIKGEIVLSSGAPGATDAAEEPLP
jgi:hypothetical protein